MLADSPDRQPPAVRGAGRFSVGHPIDVASGTVTTDVTDYVIPGSFPLRLERGYSSAAVGLGDGLFGPGWSSPFESWITPSIEGFVLFGRNGDQQIPFETPTSDEADRWINFAAFRELRTAGDDLLVIEWQPTGAALATSRYVRRDSTDVWWLSSIAIDRRESIEIDRDARGRIIALRQQRARRGYRIHLDRYGRAAQVDLVGSIEGRGEAMTGTTIAAVARYEYDARGQLMRAMDRVGALYEYRYDETGALTYERIPCGMEYEFRYDAARRCVYTSGRNAYDAQALAYDDLQGLTRVTDSVGAVWTYFWNASGQVVRQVSPLGATKVTTFDDFGRITAVTDEREATRRFAYDASGNCATVQAENGATTRRQFDADHRIVAIVDPAGNEWRRTYAGATLTSAHLPDGSSWSYEYDEHDQLVAIVPPTGARRRLEWDALGQFVAFRDDDASGTQVAYDEWGHQARITDALGRTTAFRYDPDGLVAEVVTADGAVRRYSHNAAGLRTEIADESGRVVRLEYGGCGQLTALHRPDGSTVRLRWATVPGRLVSVTNAKGQRYEYDYDADGRVVTKSDFDGRVTRFEYGRGPLPVAAIDPAGHRLEFRRDERGALTSIQHDDGTTITYAYDDRGLLVGAENADITITREYDTVGRLVAEHQGDHEIETEFGLLAQRKSRQSSLGYRTEYDWNDTGHVSALRPRGHEPLRFNYHRNKEDVASLEFGDVDITFEQDVRGRQTALDVRRGARGQWRAGGSPVLRRVSRFDLRGCPTEEWDSRTGAIDYEYDAAGRLERANLQDLLVERVAYDEDGAVRAIARSPAGNGSTPAGESRRATSGTGTFEQPTIRLDEYGRVVEQQTSDGTTQYTWNAHGHLASIRRADGVEVRFAYDPFGRRVRKTTPSESVEYVWDNNVVLHEIKRSTANGDRRVVTWEHEPFGFTPLARFSGREADVAICDHLGRPVHLVSRDGAITWSARSSPWGVSSALGTDPWRCPIRRPGEWADRETGLVYNRHRYYDPALARYMSPDPIGLAGGLDMVGYSPNPVAWIDPLGLGVICPQKAQQIADEFEKHFGKKPDEIWLVGSWAEAELNGGHWDPDPYSGPGKSDIDIYIVTDVPNVSQEGGTGFAFFAAINPGQIPPGVTGRGYGPGQALLSNNTPGAIPKAGTFDPFFGPGPDTSRPAIKVWP